MPILTLKNISKAFRLSGKVAVPAVVNLSLSISEGEFSVITGPTGCGKTTTLRLIAGLESPDSGVLEINGRDAAKLEPGLRQIGMVFQQPALYPHLKVKENLVFPLLLRRSSKAVVESKARELASLLGLEELLERQPASLSGGQQQKVALGRALASDSKILLLDEPFSNLDAASRRELRLELLRLKKKLGLTVVYVTHDQSEALAMAETLQVLRAGTLQQAGSPHEIYHEPANQFVATFIGSPPMNFFPARHVWEEGLHQLRSVGGKGRMLAVLPGDLANRLKENSRGENLMAGIRPENVSIGPAGGIPAEIEFIENIGPENLVYWRSEVGSLVSRETTVHGLKPDQARNLQFDVRKLYFFDPQSGVRIGNS